ncbi:hypothetical protein Bind_1460 [Beijerinckia indica subsp. indica ATCC 9039]|uniref:Uncharacterized protein n=1 Tax=Beijerinckia indica subsp. indica (strain ATCC 9039 / DSM 1715 / NCIMB 8712) TaxID=395963 RepID=B2IKQ8_BEII9|nr:hypothetical protein Bind_1460 [Beijerinckia indica subsp. indica ATCC 9039]
MHQSDRLGAAHANFDRLVSRSTLHNFEDVNQRLPELSATESIALRARDEARLPFNTYSAFRRPSRSYIGLFTYNYLKFKH